mmetsp:Transcript_14081/g.33233  ORF Transcript_14081/g.33233 Transcript_14081/m.33233 type:complete len:143 (-) Transcript_14081:91-519(-)
MLPFRASVGSASRLPALRGFLRSAGTKSSEPPSDSTEEPDPPSTVVAVASMGFGAFGAVAVAAVGVYGAFKMALWAAKESGRSIEPDKSSNPEGAHSDDDPARDRQEALERELSALRAQARRSAESDARKAQIKEELRALQQ